MKKLLVFAVILTFMASCGGKDDGPVHLYRPTTAPKQQETNDGKGIGEITNVNLNNPLEPEMVARGKAIYEMKCSACHKLTDQRVVGPGWTDVTERRKPEWIMNMITNVDIMLAKDPVAQELLKECLTRMPNQNLSVGDARDVLEFMYANDGQDVGSE